MAEVANDPNPPTPAIPNAQDWITAYLQIHQMSIPSRRYAFFLWLIVIFIFLTFAILHVTGSTAGSVGARWNKWALRRRTWRKQSVILAALSKGETPRPTSLPPNGQLLCMAVLLIASIALGFGGPDYISPTIHILEVNRRGLNYDSPNYPGPQYTIWKAWWTSGGRTGIIAFALFPLCVLFALKAPPFAFFAIPFTIQIHFDKLAWLHRWSGRLIWVFTTAHVALWSIQLLRDQNASTGLIAYTYAWQHEEFIWGWIAFGILTLVLLLSIHPLRQRHYEAFWFLHVLLVPLTLVMSALHHPPIWWWCWGALALWVGERTWRGMWWFHTNGFFGGMKPNRPLQEGFTSESKRLMPTPDCQYPPSSSSSLQRASMSLTDTQRTPIHFTPPPGYAHAELLSGRTIRLTFISPGFLSWAPGQNFLINIPYISKVTSHPFTCASICDEQAIGDAGRAMVFLIRAKSGWTEDLWDAVMDLTSRYHHHPPREKMPEGTVLPKRGVLFRMYVDGPFGSSVRARWGSNSTAVIISGGSGISFGLSIIQYICFCIAGREGQHLGGNAGGWGKKGFQTRRIRFVWLIRDFAHLQWSATALRLCLNMVPADALQIDIFVTNCAAPVIKPVGLAPPTPRFARGGGGRSRSNSASSVGSEQSPSSPAEEYIDRSTYLAYFGDEPEHSDPLLEMGVKANYTLDLTNWEGDVDAALPGEELLAQKIRKTGKHRRTNTRKLKEAQGRPKVFHGSSQDASKSLDGLLLQTRNSGVAISVTAPHESHTNSLYLASPLSAHSLHSPAYPSSAYSPMTPHSFSDMQDTLPRPGSSLSYSNWDPNSDASSVHRLITHDSDQPSQPEVRLEVCKQEMHDVGIISEYCRPGKPKLDRILTDEVNQSRGSLIVACCGPASLNAMVRRSIASQIDPQKIRRGDMRGSISLVSEEFQY